MINLHGLILADRSANELRELVMCRTAASVPFAGRYRLIDFSLSSLQNAGVRDVGVIMQQDYQSLLDHIGSGKEWDMSRKRGGLRLLPPFGRQSGVGEYVSVIDALLAVRGYISDVKQDYIFLTRGSLAVNLDLADIMAAHLKSGADVTAVCMPGTPAGTHHRFVADENGRVTELLFRRSGPGRGVAAMEAYIMAKTTLLDIIDRCDSALARHFHRDGLGGLFRRLLDGAVRFGGRPALCRAGFGDLLVVAGLCDPAGRHLRHAGLECVAQGRGRGQGGHLPQSYAACRGERRGAPAG